MNHTNFVDDDTAASTFFTGPSTWLDEFFSMSSGESWAIPPAPRMASAQLPFGSPYPLLQDIYYPPRTPIMPGSSSHTLSVPTPSTVDPSVLRTPSSSIISPTSSTVACASRLHAAMGHNSFMIQAKQEPGTMLSDPLHMRATVYHSGESSDDSSESESDSDLPQTSCPRHTVQVLAPPAEILPHTITTKVCSTCQDIEASIQDPVTAINASDEPGKVPELSPARARARPKSSPRKKRVSSTSHKNIKRDITPPKPPARDCPASAPSRVNKTIIVRQIPPRSIKVARKPPLPEVKLEPDFEYGWPIALSRPRRSASTRRTNLTSYTSSPSPTPLPTTSRPLSSVDQLPSPFPEVKASPLVNTWSPSSEGSSDAYVAPKDPEEVDEKPVVGKSKMKVARKAKGKGRDMTKRKPQNVTSASTYRRKKKDIDDGYLDFFIELDLLTRNRSRSGLVLTIRRLVDDRLAAIQQADGAKGNFYANLHKVIQEKLEKRQH